MRRVSLCYNIDAAVTTPAAVGLDMMPKASGGLRIALAKIVFRKSRIIGYTRKGESMGDGRASPLYQPVEPSWTEVEKWGAKTTLFLGIRKIGKYSRMRLCAAR